MLVPASRHEKTPRVGINELTMGIIAIGVIGGLFEAPSTASVFTPSSELAQPPHDMWRRQGIVAPPGNKTNAVKILEDWGNKIIPWALIKPIADRVVGRVVSSSPRDEEMVKHLSAASVLARGLINGPLVNSGKRTCNNPLIDQPEGTNKRIRATMKERPTWTTL